MTGQPYIFGAGGDGTPFDFSAMAAVIRASFFCALGSCDEEISPSDKLCSQHRDLVPPHLLAAMETAWERCDAAVTSRIGPAPQTAAAIRTAVAAYDEAVSSVVAAAEATDRRIGHRATGTGWPT